MRLADLVKDVALRPYIDMKIVGFLLPIKPAGPDDIITVIAFRYDFQVCLGIFFCKFIKGVSSAFESSFLIWTFEDFDIAFIQIDIQKRNACPVRSFCVALVSENCGEEKRNAVACNLDFSNVRIM